jgi:hypothetical protein
MIERIEMNRMREKRAHRSNLEAFLDFFKSVDFRSGEGGGWTREGTGGVLERERWRST